MEPPLLLSLHQNLGDYSVASKKITLLPPFQTMQALSAKFGICFLEYIDFSLL